MWGSWVTMISVTCCSRLRFNSRSMISWAVVLSRLPVGSSARITEGCQPGRGQWPRAGAGRRRGQQGGGGRARRGRPVRACAGHVPPIHAATRRDNSRAARRCPGTQAGQQVEALEHETDLLVADRRQLIGGGVENIVAGKVVLAAVRQVQQAEDVEQGALPDPEAPRMPQLSPLAMDRHTSLRMLNSCPAS